VNHTEHTNTLCSCSSQFWNILVIHTDGYYWALDWTELNWTEQTVLCDTLTGERYSCCSQTLCPERYSCCRSDTVQTLCPEHSSARLHFAYSLWDSELQEIVLSWRCEIELMWDKACIFICQVA
jgi:hypothetical protein